MFLFSGKPRAVARDYFVVSSIMLLFAFFFEDPKPAEEASA